MDRRRLLDTMLAAVLLVLAAPVMLLLALANRSLSGRAFFVQERLGQDLRPFRLFKYQTMVDGADQGSTVTVARDARVTRFGGVLRTLKLDELPQLINVLRGEMTFVGPRPLTPNEIAAIPRPLAALVYRQPPGLTGIASLAFHDEERLLAQAADPLRTYFNEILPRKIAVELAYVQRRTWATDLLILAFTPFAPLWPRLRRALVAWLVPDAAAWWPAKGRAADRTDAQELPVRVSFK
ncbi:MAG: sugar transferase [Armatimonadota bacterium]|nr:sugar transferase [Armatimonadota bacterium]MDR7448506.1 sugar transferase [Armatimonadota bacterium]MDR7459094.1 sugar transferase [Armatimonadota bacterium]MDR7479410.1 sugar transferase [Armatimonadota bacterium]MDR7487452.1 sugar transferase [Armatimonadota bacterium]